MTHSTIGKDGVMLMADTVDEAGLMCWLAKRYKGKFVTLEFDTSMRGSGNTQCPTLWITPIETGSESVEK